MPDVNTTSTQQSLGNGPASQPHTGTKKPNLMGTSTQVPLNTRTEHRVAQLGAKPGHGQVMCNSTTVSLSRKATHPYDDKKMAREVPILSGSKGRKK